MKLGEKYGTPSDNLLTRAYRFSRTLLPAARNDPLSPWRRVLLWILLKALHITFKPKSSMWCVFCLCELIEGSNTLCLSRHVDMRSSKSCLNSAREEYPLFSIFKLNREKSILVKSEASFLSLGPLDEYVRSSLAKRKNLVFSVGTIRSKERNKRREVLTSL